MSLRRRERRRYGGAGVRRSFGSPYLNGLSDDELLDMRIRDLGIQIEDTPLEPRIERVNHELELKQLRFRPHFWLSDEWYTPDGVPGVAIPFYLAHPRLIRLERKMMLEVEGGTEDWCMRILRHEVGHAIDNAYRLRRRRRWRETFGRASQTYLDYYAPKPYSRSFVLHLDAWYAQSHPVEDFAETFAVWLKPKSCWRAQYEGWPALKKLEYVDDLMHEIRGTKAKVSCRERPDSVGSLRTTLGDHYQKKRTHYGIESDNYFDYDLRRLFSDAPEHARRLSAAVFLRRLGPKLRREVAHWTNEYQYTINQVLNGMVERCRELKLRLSRHQREVERDALILLTIHTMNYLHDGHHRVFL